MFLRFEERRKRRAGVHGKRLQPIEKLKPRHVGVYRCDVCGKEYDDLPRKIKRKYHFCTKDCRYSAQRIGGILCKHDIALIKHDVLKRAWNNSHTKKAEEKRSQSLQYYHANKPDNWTNPGNSQKACKKRHETMKQNGTYRKSSVEDALYDFLCQKYGAEDIERNRYMNRWPIDFYIKSINTYVQLDGVYWHGLDRPIEVVAEYRTKRDVQIHKKWLTDRRQDEWFAERQLKLVRLTDVDFYGGERP